MITAPKTVSSLAALTAIAATGALDASASRTPTVGSEGCTPGGFVRDVYNDPENLIVGPLALLGGRWVEQAPLERVRNGQKLMARVRNGHRVTVSVARESRSNARLAYGPTVWTRRGGLRRFENLPTRLRFVACPRGGHSGPRTPKGHVKATSFPGSIRLRRAPACVRLKVTVDDRDPVYRTIGFAMQCPEP
jgi:hypothetical protein